MLATPAETVRAHIRAISLATLQSALDHGGADGVQLRNVNASVVERACLDPAFRLWGAGAALCGMKADATTALRLLSFPTVSKDSPFYLSKTPLLAQIVGPLGDCLVQDADLVRKAWIEAENLISELDLTFLLKLMHGVDLIAGIHGPWGEIRSLSNPGFPGFVAIGVDGPPLSAAEQAVHESMHVVLSARLAMDPQLAELTDDRIAVLSPFTDTVRTIDRVIHGILSYSAVEALWRAVATTPVPERCMGLSDRETARIIADRRVQAINARIRLAMRFLFDGAGPDICARVADLLGELAGLGIEYMPARTDDRRTIVADAGYSTDLGGLPPIQLAEVTAAILGTKVSRITVPIADISTIGFPLAAHICIAASSWVFSSVPDTKIGGFSNISRDAKHILDAESGEEVHLYVHPDAAFVRQAVILDLEDRAGDLFGIPDCCRNWYSREWSTARDTGGDLFAVMAKRAARHGHVTIAPECDASAMYRGGGLCWHFPCSPNCSETIRIVKSRRKLLEGRNPTLLAKIDCAARSVMTISADGTYDDGGVPSDGAIIINFS